MRVFSLLERRTGSVALVFAALVFLVFAGAGSSNRSSLSPHATVFATGLDNPRGLTFGPDGNLYVAEAGVGGSMTTDAHQCQQVPPPVGPYSAGFTARISKIDAHGVRSTVVDGLPSDKTSDAFPGGALVSGVADVEFVGGQLYALISGAGCSHGLEHTVNNLRILSRTRIRATSSRTATGTAWLRSTGTSSR